MRIIFTIILKFLTFITIYDIVNIRYYLMCHFLFKHIKKKGRGINMKKILTLALVLSMLLGVLTSCFTVFPQMRHTIYEDEWQAALDSTNYTFEKTVTLRDIDGNIVEQYIAKIMVTENAYRTDKDGKNVSYFSHKNGSVYTVEDNDGVWEERQLEGETWVQPKLSGHITGLAEIDFFGLLQYNEGSKSYVWEQDGEKIEFYFENGKLVRGTIGSMCKIYNVNRTYVSIPFPGSNSGNQGEGGYEDENNHPLQKPDYLLERPTNSGPITESEWNEALKNNTFSLRIFNLEEIGGATHYFHERSIECTESYVIDNYDSSVIKVDGYWHAIKHNGFWYGLEPIKKDTPTPFSYNGDIVGAMNLPVVGQNPNENHCIAKRSIENLEMTIRKALRIDVNYSDLTYDEELGCYVYNDEFMGYDVCLYFVDGALVYAEHIQDSTVIAECSIGINSILDAKVAMKDWSCIEYTFEVNGTSTTEDRWNKLLAEKNFYAELEGSVLDYWSSGTWHTPPHNYQYMFDNNSIEINSPYSEKSNFYVLENGVWYNIVWVCNSLSETYHYVRYVCNEAHANSVGTFLAQNNFTSLDFNSFTYNSELNVYETECDYVFDGQNVHVNVVVNFIDDSCVEIYIASTVEAKEKYYFYDDNDPVLKITISGIGEQKVVVTDDYEVIDY